MYPQNDILARMRRRRVLEPSVGSTPPIALEQDAEMGRSDPWSERLPDGRTVNEAVMETLRRSSQPQYRGSDRPEEQDDRIMRLPASGEVVVGEGGKIEGFGTQRDYEPLAGVNREAILEALKRGTAVPLGGNQTRTAHDTAIPLGSSSTPSSAVPLGGKTFGSGFPAPDEQEFAGGQEQRPWKAGYGVGETDPLKRESARIRAMIENPTSKVLPGGQVESPHPMSRWKAALLGGLFGLAQGDRNTSLAERLAAGGTGAAIGGIKPRAIQEWRRRMEVEDAQGQLAAQTKLLGGQAQLENLQANTAETRAGLMPDPDDPTKMIKRPPKRAPQYVERSDGVYEISEGYPNGRRVGNIPAEVKSTKRSVHYEAREDGVYAIYEDETGALKSTKVEGVPGKPASDAQAAQAAEGEAIAETTQAAADALKAELDQQKGQLLENERAITAKEAWWNSQAAKLAAESGGELKLADALAQVQAADPDYQSGGHGQLLNNTKALRDVVGDKEKQLRDMAADVRKGSAKAARSSRRGRKALSSAQRDQIIEKAKAAKLDPNRAVQVAEDLLNR